MPELAIGAGQMAQQAGLYALDTQMVYEDTLLTVSGIPHAPYQELSQIGQTVNPYTTSGWGDFWWQATNNAGQAGAAAGSLGVIPMVDATVDYASTGNSSQYQQTMGGIAAANLVGATSEGFRIRMAGRSEPLRSAAPLAQHVDGGALRSFEPILVGAESQPLISQTFAGAGLTVEGQLSTIISAAPARPTLPPFTGQTYGVLITYEGNSIPLQSGSKLPGFSNYPASGHVEGMAAIIISETGSAGGWVFHNHTSGTCNMCHTNIPTLLPEGVPMTVSAPPGTVPLDQYWHVTSEPYIGNANVPKPPKPMISQ